MDDKTEILSIGLGGLLNYLWGKVKGDKHVSCYQRDITKQTSI